MSLFEITSGLVLLHVIMAVVVIFTKVLSKHSRLDKMAMGLMLAVIILQGFVLAEEIFYKQVMLFSRPFYMQILAFTLAVLSLSLWRSSRFSGLVLVFMPTVLCLVLTSILVGQAEPLPKTHGLFFSIHVMCMLVAFVLMAVNFGLGIFFLIQEQAIKRRGQLSAFQQQLPALTWLDKAASVSTIAGFIAYSLGILFGLVAARLAWGKLFSGDPKELVSLVIWLLFAVLLHQRLAKGWRGRKPAILAIIIFVAAVFSLFVVNTLLTTHHGFMAG